MPDRRNDISLQPLTSALHAIKNAANSDQRDEERRSSGKQYEYLADICLQVLSALAEGASAEGKIAQVTGAHVTAGDELWTGAPQQPWQLVKRVQEIAGGERRFFGYHGVITVLSAADPVLVRRITVLRRAPADLRAQTSALTGLRETVSKMISTYGPQPSAPQSQVADLRVSALVAVRREIDAALKQLQRVTLSPSSDFARSAPVLDARLCPECGDYGPCTDEGYSGALSGDCDGCGRRCREVHRFAAQVAHEQLAACACRSGHPSVKVRPSAQPPETQ